MTARENSRSRLGGSESRFNSQSSVDKCCIVDPKMIFSKNQERIISPQKCKHTPFPAELAGAYTKFRYTSKGLRVEMRADMRISRGLLFIWGVVPSF
jgi:hypothetical protein